MYFSFFEDSILAFVRLGEGLRNAREGVNHFL